MSINLTLLKDLLLICIKMLELLLHQELFLLLTYSFTILFHIIIHHLLLVIWAILLVAQLLLIIQLILENRHIILLILLYSWIHIFLLPILLLREIHVLFTFRSKIKHIITIIYLFLSFWVWNIMHLVSDERVHLLIKRLNIAKFLRAFTVNLWFNLGALLVVSTFISEIFFRFRLSKWLESS